MSALPDDDMNAYPASVPKTVVLYQCDLCGQAYESRVRADRLSSCRSEDCAGQPKRVWKLVSFTRVPGGGRA